MKLKKLLIFLGLLSLMGCKASKVSYTTFKREYKENRFTKQFQEADSMFNQKYLLK
nr:MAG TPA: outer membrane protein assembly factor [Caudoviricetes sp.]